MLTPEAAEGLAVSARVGLKEYPKSDIACSSGAWTDGATLAAGDSAWGREERRRSPETD